jgi:hypothetical protein
MPFINDFAAAIDSYATGNCKTEIVNFSIVAGGATINVGEIFQFQVKVTNESVLDMINVKVQALASTYADVSLAAGAFGSSALSGAFNLQAHQSHTTGFFRGKAKARTSGIKDIVSARIYTWDANLDHLLKEHSTAGAAEGKLSKEVLAD